MSTLVSSTSVLLDTLNMSLQRVLETARKTGMPVIITDIMGREPMVILPLEQFEAMAGVPATVRQVPQPEVSQIPVEMSVETLKTRVKDSTAPAQSFSPAENPDFPLEEGFYLEPVDDNLGQK